jgi:hypothetical protein
MSNQSIFRNSPIKHQHHSLQWNQNKYTLQFSQPLALSHPLQQFLETRFKAPPPPPREEGGAQHQMDQIKGAVSHLYVNSQRRSCSRPPMLPGTALTQHDFITAQPKETNDCHQLGHQSQEKGGGNWGSQWGESVVRGNLEKLWGILAWSTAYSFDPLFVCLNSVQFVRK